MADAFHLGVRSGHSHTYSFLDPPVLSSHFTVHGYGFKLQDPSLELGSDSINRHCLWPCILPGIHRAPHPEWALIQVCILKNDNLLSGKSVQFESLNLAAASDILDDQIPCKRTDCGSIDVKRMNCFLGSFVCFWSYSTLILSKFNKSTDVHILSAPYFHKTAFFTSVYLVNNVTLPYIDSFINRAPEFLLRESLRCGNSANYKRIFEFFREARCEK